MNKGSEASIDKVRFILIGNYPPDGQESMRRFSQMLDYGIRETGHDSEIWHPKAYLSVWATSTLYGLGKWLGYIDKWIIFPVILQWRLLNTDLQSPSVRFHVCDHSNAPYLKYLPHNRTGITCHDVLAIRGALGYNDAYCPATSTGRIFQQWILKSLSLAKLLAADSQLTLNQLCEIAIDQKNSKKNWQTIHIGFNDNFGPTEPERKKELLNTIGITTNDVFLLHVGSGLPRKNRKLLLDMVAALGNRWKGRICFAGQSVDEQFMAYATSLNLQERIISIVKPNHATLVALYSACEAFIFPSFSEGFGWPVIEAQACGAPVIASNLEPMPEVGGNAALYANPNNPQSFANAFLSLKNEDLRSDLISKGFANCSRFKPTKMINQYLKLHGIESAES